MKNVGTLVAIVAAFIINCSAFSTNVITSRRRSPTRIASSSSDASTNERTPVNLVSADAFVTAIDVLKRDMGMEPVPQEERSPMYAIGKLVAKLPLELVSGIRLADCESLTLISQLKQSVVDITGIQSLDTIVAIRAGFDGNGEGYEGNTSGASIGDTASVYTAAVNHAMENQLKEIELEVNRLVPMMASEE
ncbi:hypothetical protein HJC23_004848 [Cyclotella cryptica]|uniref:Uncharacterized protein n=1 Tax=Cyclotella cryptica TaxID=29204 RepID=A0ABD3P0M3_9STRA|eukprot:CCRYP_018296-RA/>CCRYP_018296-RA protein AED:0.00 eAED:0.00 QI:272/-1/1/1/-1/1/1/252/191